MTVLTICPLALWFRSNSKSRPDMPKTPTSPVTPTFASSTPCFLTSCYLTGDSVRDKCIEMVSAALKMDGELQYCCGLLVCWVKGNSSKITVDSKKGFKYDFDLHNVVFRVQF